MYVIFKPRRSTFESEDLCRYSLGIQCREALGRGEGGKEGEEGGKRGDGGRERR